MSLVWVTVTSLAYSENVKFLIYITSLSFVFTSMQGLFSCVLRGTQNFFYDGLLQVANMIGLFGGILFVVLLDYGLLGLVYSQLFVQIVVLLLCVGIYFRKYGLNYALFSGYVFLVSILKKSAPFALISIVLPIYYQINIILLSKLSGYEATGIYAAAYKIILMVEMISRLFAQVLFPSLAGLFVTSKEDFTRIIYYSCRAIALGVFPITFGLFLIGDRIVIILFKHEFADAIPALQIMAFSLLFSSLLNVLTAGLNAGKQEKKVATVMIMATATNIIMNLILIPGFAYIGASISMLVSEILRFAGNYYYFRKKIFKIYFAGAIGKVIGACLIMSLFVIWFKQMVSLPVLIAIAGLLYFVLIWLFGVASNDEIKKLINLFTKKRLAAQTTK